jgi:molybdopterin-guanine dinucleotide biosynthesis protein A
MTLSYAIPVCNEWIQLEYLLNYLFKNKREQDEIVVQCDKGILHPQFTRYSKNTPLTILWVLK